MKSETNPGWITSALNNIDSVIIDHAHCEKKAAGTGMSLLNSYPDKTEISLKMCDLIEEEVGHYRSVVKILQDKGIVPGKDEGDDYVKQLLSHVSKNEPMRLLDRLLTAGIIEARSCERLQILADHLSDPQLKSFYNELAASEAGHYVTFVKLARLYFKEELIKTRLDELTDIEMQITASLPNLPKMHG